MNLYDLSLEELTELVESWGEKPFRAKQIRDWLYKQKVSDPTLMSNLPQSLREKLSDQTRIGVLTPVKELHSSDGHTVKVLYRLNDDQLIESVLMDYDDQRHTACISTQAGCAMGCVFCATGQMGFARNLTAGEIVEQALWFARQLEQNGERLSNIVMMGMGEPLHNYEATMQAVELINAHNGLGIGQRHITVSTVGLVPGIIRFADEGLQVGLAVSLHAATDDERSALIPINKKWNLPQLMDACRYYVKKTGRRITFEWALIAGKTDTLIQAHALGRLIRHIHCHVNAIPLNPTGGYAGKPSDPQQVKAWQEVLGDYGVSSTIRVRRGIDIQAGCGQLKSEVLHL
ncbi:MAG TPA: 23S rRNA (adenine(2503)-C(2))-methyltransferase RlmN [Aggregatilineales bacterium]|nr:23S rRNA (adenine(2503)-C(2))-methyltransferase RlmN [Aggregatilineales bacterium]